MTIFRFMHDIYSIYEFLLDDISFYLYNKAKGIIGEINMHDQNEYEFVNYSKLKHFQIGFVEILYRNLHIHKEFEIGLILNGSADILYNQQRYPVIRGIYSSSIPTKPMKSLLRKIKARASCICIFHAISAMNI